MAAEAVEWRAGTDPPSGGHAVRRGAEGISPQDPYTGRIRQNEAPLQDCAQIPVHDFEAVPGHLQKENCEKLP